MIKVLDNLPLESPLNKFCYNMDRRLAGKNIFEYHAFAKKVDTTYSTNLFLEDLKFRCNSQLNALIEIYAEQGTGKSLFGQNIAGHLGQIYEKPFNMEKHTLGDLDLLDQALHNTPFRTSFVVDEQKREFFGYGSERVSRSLRDFEEICRYTLKNIIYISPTQREHSSYYLFKEGDFPSVERNRNQTCLDCSKQRDCMKIYSAKTRFKTLCGIDFWERHGYPKSFCFLLCTSRKFDNTLLPRCYVRFPVLPPALMIKYDAIKNRNIKVYESKESFGWQKQREQLKEFQKLFKDKLINEKGKIVSKDLIKGYLMDHFGGRAFTTIEIDIFCALVKAEIKSDSFADQARTAIKEERDFAIT